MTRPDSKQKNRQQVERQQHLIASAAARLMAEDGITDYVQAKRKAAQGLGLPENTRLPDNAEVEAELRSYQRLFQDEAQRQRIDHLRKVAREIMSLIQRFNPTSPVRYSTVRRDAIRRSTSSYLPTAPRMSKFSCSTSASTMNTAHHAPTAPRRC